MKTAFITGSTDGIGFEIARQLAGRDFRVWISGRDEEAGLKATQRLLDQKLDVQFLFLDAGDLASIRNAYAKLRDQTESLDVLINNAAVHLDGSSSILEIDADKVVQTIHINVLGPLFIAQVFAPLLRKGSRVINISSGAGQISDGMREYAPVYSISKTALNAVTCQLAYGFKPRGIAVNAVSPGWVRTRMGGNNATRTVEEGAETPVWLATDAPIEQTGFFWRDKAVISW